LCGGRSSRMGQPKALLRIGHTAMLSHVVDVLREVVDPIVVAAAPGQSLPELPSDVLVIRDPVPNRGPMQGLAAGLHALRGRVDAAFVASCDLPMLTPSFIRRLIELSGDHEICVPCIDGVHHPLAGVYRVDIADAVERLLATDRLRLTALLQEQPTRLVSAAELHDVDPKLTSLCNVNTLADYEAARRTIMSQPSSTQIEKGGNLPE